MIELPFDTTLTRVANGATVPAQIVSLTRLAAKLNIDAAWWQLPGVSGERRNAENDHSWQWRTEVGSLVNNRWRECVAVVSENDEIQGAMSLRLDAKSFVHESLGVVHIHALATAPRNRDWLVKQPQFRGAGSSLIEYAVARSYELGLAGRVNLFTFEDSRTLSFFENKGFQRLDGQHETIAEPMFELDEDSAKTILISQGYEL